MIVRHQRESASNRGFRHLARYIQGRDAKPRATWFHAPNLPGVSGKDDLELACKLVDAVQAQNTRAGSKRTYHLVISLHPDDRRLARQELQQIVERLVHTLGFSEHQYIAVRHNDTDHEHIHVAINKIHPETFRIHSPAWDHQKLFTGARALERELGLTPLRSRTRDRERVPQRAADCEAHRGVESFARWAREEIRPALHATELRSWDDVHDVCGRFGVVIRPHGNGLVFEDADRGVRVKASFVARELSKARLCKQLGSFQPASERHLQATRQAQHRYSPSWRSQSLWKEYEHSLDQARTQRQESWKSYRDAASRERQRLKQKYRVQRRVINAYPCQLAIEASSCDNSRSGKRSKLGALNESSQSNAKRFRKPGIPAPGATSSPGAPLSAMLVRSDLCSNESGYATVSATKGSCEIHRNGVNLQIGNPNPVNEHCKMR